MQAIQEDQNGFNNEFIHGMFKEKPDPEEQEWILAEMNKLPASIESTIVFNQTAVDYRETVSNVDVPTLICFGLWDFFQLKRGNIFRNEFQGQNW